VPLKLKSRDVLKRIEQLCVPVIAAGMVAHVPIIYTLDKQQKKAIEGFVVGLFEVKFIAFQDLVMHCLGRRLIDVNSFANDKSPPLSNAIKHFGEHFAKNPLQTGRQLAQYLQSHYIDQSAHVNKRTKVRIDWRKIEVDHILDECDIVSDSSIFFFAVVRDSHETIIVGLFSSEAAALRRLLRVRLMLDSFDAETFQKANCLSDANGVTNDSADMEMVAHCMRFYSANRATMDLKAIVERIDGCFHVAERGDVINTTKDLRSMVICSGHFVSSETDTRGINVSFNL
jgi:hypothetical protein